MNPFIDQPRISHVTQKDGTLSISIRKEAKITLEKGDGGCIRKERTNAVYRCFLNQLPAFESHLQTKVLLVRAPKF